MCFICFVCFVFNSLNLKQTVNTCAVCFGIWESAREEQQSQGAAGPAQELKDAGAPRLRVMPGSNWDKERDRICERHMALFRRIEALEGGEKETGQLKRTIQHSAKQSAPGSNFREMRPLWSLSRRRRFLVRCRSPCDQGCWQREVRREPRE